MGEVDRSTVTGGSATKGSATGGFAPYSPVKPSSDGGGGTAAAVSPMMGFSIGMVFKRYSTTGFV